MREAGLIVAQVLEQIRDKVKPGVSTEDLDAFAYDFIVKHKAKPAFKGYHGFPASLCTSVNSEVVHGIPSKKRVLKEGDIISIDVGAIREGFVGDGAWTFPVGQVSDVAKRLLETTEGALMAGIAQVRSGKHLEDI